MVFQKQYDTWNITDDSYNQNELFCKNCPVTSGLNCCCKNQKPFFCRCFLLISTAVTNQQSINPGGYTFILNVAIFGNDHNLVNISIHHDSWWWHFHHRLVSICIFQCTRLLTNQVQGFRAFGFWYSSLAVVRRQGNLPKGKSVCSVCILSVLADSTIGWRAFQRPNQRRPVKCSPERLDVNFSPVCVCVAYPYPYPATSSSLPIIPHICI